MKFSRYCIWMMLLATGAFAQGPVNPVLLKGHWPSKWITATDAPAKEYGVYHFRKSFELTAKPGRFIVHVTGDNRYRLFVNGTPVVSGPARGDLYNWYFETVDIAPHLKAGKNVVAALVWNMGAHAAVAQISNMTGFVLQGDTETEKIINTNRTWKVYNDSAYTPCSLDNGARLRSYMVIGPGDDVKGSAYPWGWELPAYDDAPWKNAREVTSPVTAGYGTDNMWTLAPRNIPLMEESKQRMSRVRRAGVKVKDGFLRGTDPLTIPGHQTVSILVDQDFNTVAYPQLLVSKGAGSSIRLTYAEALFKNGQKGHRDVIDSMEIAGNYDIFHPDGGEQRMFRPLWFRTFRYLQLDITTGAEPLVINDLYGMYTGYPFEEKASFSSNDPSLQEIWKVGWRTARLCAGETYFDCPYYEQLQYEGDTRIQALISLYVTGDDRLVRKAIHDFYCSRVPEGLTQGRYPSNRLQVIPPFSLYWVSMIYDYWMHRKDDAFIRQYLSAARGVLDWYENKIDKKMGMLGPMKWWNFTDWDDAFPNGVPAGANEGNSSVISLQFAYTLQQAAPLFEAFGQSAQADHYRKLAKQLTDAVYRHCYDAGKGAMANTPEKQTFSQHAGIMAVLSGAIPAADEQQFLQRVITDTLLSKATIYYRFYLMLALKKTGMGDRYYEQLTPWRDMLKIGLTTFAEKEEPTRSDCHAWSASPNYDFLATICGIMPGSPGFSSVRVEPAMGALTEAEGKMPLPEGEVTVSLKRKKNNGVQAVIILPGSLKGEFKWNGKTVALHPGKQEINL